MASDVYQEHQKKSKGTAVTSLASSDLASHVMF